ncbi:hypothetical protein D3C73_652180 [compost metagenome]
MKVSAVTGSMVRHIAVNIFAAQKLNFRFRGITLFLSRATNQINIPEIMTKQPMTPKIKYTILSG